jgi:hypothetical protein
MEFPQEIVAIIREYSRPCFKYFREQGLLTRLSGRRWPLIDEGILPFVMICIRKLESANLKEKTKAIGQLHHVWSLFISLNKIKELGTIRDTLFFKMD